jgi:hypothetical protein
MILFKIDFGDGMIAMSKNLNFFSLTRLVG